MKNSKDLLKLPFTRVCKIKSHYNQEDYDGATPMQTFSDSIHIAKSKNIGSMEKISDNLMIIYHAA